MLTAPERETVAAVLGAYARGWFPMADPERAGVGLESRAADLGWYDPDPRGVLPIGRGFHVPRRLAKTARSGLFRLTSDLAFDAVVFACADPGREGAWIDGRIAGLFNLLHRAGHAHSVEAWRPIETIDGHERGLPLIEPDLGGVRTFGGVPHALVGGLYGLALAGLFAGESMFHRADLGGTDAGKLCLVETERRLRAGGFVLFDTQMCSRVTEAFGCREILRGVYRRRLAAAMRTQGVWATDEN
ncbi:MAG: leucyl/phenylalanyl-tRNA--protein transferase [Phycisphaerales bacterium]|nr:MAG: leucyl/phenylalanyl-tRNA--protein transferase [Phycisphaerales bacterium]